MHLGASLQNVHTFFSSHNMISIKIGSTLFKLSEILYRLHCALRTEQALDIDSPQRWCFNTMSKFLRSDVTDKMSGSVAMTVSMTVETCYAQHTIVIVSSSVFRSVELLLRKLSHQEA